jgi:hypothetical protein
MRVSKNKKKKKKKGHKEKEFYPIKTAYHDDYMSRAHFFILFPAVSLPPQWLHVYMCVLKDFARKCCKKDFKLFCRKDLMTMI